MVLRISLLSIVLWSSLANAKNENYNSSIPIQSSAFTYYTNIKEIDTSDSKEIDNMPSIRSQDTVGSCFACAATTIAQKFACDTDQSIIESGSKCNNLPNNLLISQMSMIGWADTNQPWIENKTDNQIPGLPNNHKNIRLYEDRSDLSTGVNALMHSANLFKFMPESCYPFDQLVSKYGNNKDLFEEIYHKTKKIYEINKRKSTEAEVPCVNCLEELNNNFIDEKFGNKFSQATLSEALTKNTFGEFLYTLIFNNCKELRFIKKPTLKLLPDTEKKILYKSEILINLKNILNENKPVLVNSICLKIDPSTNKCKTSHSLVISGYRKICPTKNYSDSNCKYELKLHNCWGQDWQNQNNGGWVDSENLFKNINIGKDYIEPGDLSWLNY